MHLHWFCAHIEIQGPIFLQLRILKKVQKRQLSVQEPFLRCTQQPLITVLGHLMPFSSLHIQVEYVHMCTHAQNKNKPLKKEKSFLLCLLLIFPFLHKHCAFFWTLKCWTHLQNWENWCPDIVRATFLSNNKAGVKSHRLSDVRAPR